MPESPFGDRLVFRRVGTSPMALNAALGPMPEPEGVTLDPDRWCWAVVVATAGGVSKMIVRECGR